MTPDAFVSSTHFWYADNGDNVSTTINAALNFGIAGTHTFSFTVPNAFQKFMKLSNPNRSWTLKYFDGNTQHSSTFTKAGGGTITIIWYDYLGIQYNSLKELYLTGRAWIVGYYNLQGQWVNCNYEIVLSQGGRDAFTWEILGRMCHLLQDMSVPAHANIDPHDNSNDPNSGLREDSYERYFGYDYYWNANNVYSQVGSIINPYLGTDPLHFLMYTTNQIANHFGSNGPHMNQPNDFFLGNPQPEELSYLNSLNLSQFGSPTSMTHPLTTEQILNVRDKMFPQAIRATAGLLYWFAIEANLIPPPPPIPPIIASFTQSPNPLYRGNNGTVTCNLSQGNGNLSYNWSIVSGNTGFSISNDTLETVSIHYSNTDAISNPNTIYNSYENNLAIEGPGGAMLQCSVWNSAGSFIANAFVNLANTSHGCPFVYTWNGQEWIEDNNILPQSQQPDLLGQDVTDYYQLFTKPVLEDEKYYLAIGEFEEEISYLDQIKLLVIDHPKETFVTVNDEGQIIQFAKPAYYASAQLDSADVIKMLYELDNITVEASEGDTLYLTFDDVNTTAEPWILIVGQSHPIYKDKITGKILNKERESFNSFRLRRNPTYNWVLAPTTGSSTLDVQIAWEQAASIDYTDVCHKHELPSTVYQAQLEIAEHNLLGDVTTLLYTIDEEYIELNKDEFVTLTYAAPQVDENMERTFVLVSRGRYERQTNKMSKPTAIEDEIILPKETKLYSNYPNPFNPSTMISYSLRDEGRVSIKVYDILGSEVATLVKETKPAGTYEVEFNASQLPSGVYIYRMQAGSYTASKKMLLVK